MLASVAWRSSKFHFESKGQAAHLHFKFARRVAALECASFVVLPNPVTQQWHEVPDLEVNNTNFLSSLK